MASPPKRMRLTENDDRVDDDNVVVVAAANDDNIAPPSDVEVDREKSATPADDDDDLDAHARVTSDHTPSVIDLTAAADAPPPPAGARRAGFSCTAEVIKARCDCRQRIRMIYSLQGSNYTAPQTPQCGGRRVNEAICRWEKEIFALGPKTSPRRGHIVFLQGRGRI